MEKPITTKQSVEYSANNFGRRRKRRRNLFLVIPIDGEATEIFDLDTVGCYISNSSTYRVSNSFKRRHCFLFSDQIFSFDCWNSQPGQLLIYLTEMVIKDINDILLVVGSYELGIYVDVVIFFIIL